MPGARALGRMIIQDLVPLGLSNRAIMRAVRAKGHGYRTALLNADINLFSGRLRNEFHIRKLNINDVIPDYLMGPGELGQPYKYMVHYDVNWYNPATDSYSTTFEGMYTNDLGKKGDWIRANEERPKKTDSLHEELEYINMNITGVDIWAD